MVAPDVNSTGVPLIVMEGMSDSIERTP